MSELDAREKINLDGGWWSIVKDAIVWFAMESIDNSEECLDSYEEGFCDVPGAC